LALVFPAPGAWALRRHRPDLVPERLVDDGLMLAGIAGALVDGLAEVHWIVSGSNYGSFAARLDTNGNLLACELRFPGITTLRVVDKTLRSISFNLACFPSVQPDTILCTGSVCTSVWRKSSQFSGLTSNTSPAAIKPMKVNAMAAEL